MIKDNEKLYIAQVRHWLTKFDQEQDHNPHMAPGLVQANAIFLNLLRVINRLQMKIELLECNSSTKEA